MNWDLRISSAPRAHAWLVAFSLARSLFDRLWVPNYADGLTWAMSIPNTLFYIYTLYLAIPGLAGFILSKIFRRPVDMVAVLQGSILLWVVYPAVAAVSMWTGSPPQQTISWFKYIPTFSPEHNFFPTGMIVAVAVLFVAYTLLMQRNSEAGLVRVVVAVSLSLWVVYLLYYQYVYRAFLLAFVIRGVVFAAGFYDLSFMVPVLLCAGQFQAAFPDRPRRFLWYAIAGAVFSVALMILGLTAMPARHAALDGLARLVPVWRVGSQQ